MRLRAVMVAVARFSALVISLTGPLDAALSRKGSATSMTSSADSTNLSR